MKKVLATVATILVTGSMYAQSNTEKNDTIVTDTTKTTPVEYVHILKNDTVVTDTAKTTPVEYAHILKNDTVVTDTAKVEQPVGLAYTVPNDTIINDTTQNKPITPCEKKKENIIQSLIAQRKTHA